MKKKKGSNETGNGKGAAVLRKMRGIVSDTERKWPKTLVVDLNRKS